MCTPFAPGALEGVSAPALRDRLRQQHLAEARRPIHRERLAEFCPYSHEVLHEVTPMAVACVDAHLAPLGCLIVGAVDAPRVAECREVRMRSRTSQGSFPQWPGKA